MGLTTCSQGGARPQLARASPKNLTYLYCSWIQCFGIMSSSCLEARSSSREDRIRVPFLRQSILVGEPSIAYQTTKTPEGTRMLQGGLGGGSPCLDTDHDTRLTTRAWRSLEGCPRSCQTSPARGCTWSLPKDPEKMVGRLPKIMVGHGPCLKGP